MRVAGSHPVVDSLAQRHYRGVPSPSKFHHSQPLLILGRAIRESRKAASMSQEALAQAAEMDRSYIGAIERGENVVSLLALLRIATVLRTTASELLQGVS